MIGGQMFLAFDEGRVHDLPPRWDGRVVKWSPWQRSRVFECWTLDGSDYGPDGSTS